MMQPSRTAGGLEAKVIFQRWFGHKHNANDGIVDALYERIVAAARQPALYAQWHVPDTPIGRFEMISLHLFLFLRRARGEQGPLKDIAQSILDEFFNDVDSSVRELGVGDAGVPKRVKKLAKMFYGRVSAYGDALDAGNHAALRDALARNIRPDAAGWPQAGDLARYVEDVAAGLQGQAASALESGELAFPEVAAEAPVP